MRLVAALSVVLFVCQCALAQAGPADLPQRAYFGVNTGGISYYGSNLCMADAMKNSNQWKIAGTQTEWDKLDARGYPLDIPPAGVFTIVLNRFHPAGQYVVTFAGKGDVDLALQPDNGGGKLREVERSAQRIVYDVTPQQYVVLQVLKSDPQDPVRDIHVWLPGLEKTRPHWNPAWVAGLKRYGTLRLMDALSTNNSPQQHWADRPTPEQRTFWKHGVPIEWAVELANLTQANPWFCVPHMADDDYVRREAELVKAGLDPRLHVYLEYSNEVGNRAFGQFNYAAQEGIRRGYATASDPRWMPNARFHAMRSVEIFEIWRSVLGKDRVTGVVTGICRRASTFDEMRERFAYRDAWKKIDAVGTAPYIGVGIYKRFPKPIAQMGVDDVIDLLEHEQKTQIRQELYAARRIADEFGLPIVGYEGGQHLSTFGGGVPDEQRAAFLKLAHAANSDPRMEELYRLHLQDWFEIAGGLYCQWTYVAEDGNVGAWGIQHTIGESPARAPKLRAIDAFERLPTLPARRPVGKP